MKYRIVIDVALKDLSKAKEFFKKIKELKDDFFEISPKEPARISLHKCFHDESPPKPCQPIEEFIFPRRR